MLNDIEIRPHFTSEGLNMNRSFQRIAKRALDIVASSIALGLLSPLFLFFVVLIKLTSKGPVFHIQDRPGKDNRLFTFIKFRTMELDSDEILFKFLESNSQLSEEWQLYKKFKAFDPRVTRVGKLLRKYNLDELPQFMNVLKGDMTLVGPRPYLPREYEDIGESLGIILKVKPGLTGPWQVGGRNELLFKDRIEMDVDYVQDQSFKLDIVYLLKTALVMFRGTGI